MIVSLLSPDEWLAMGAIAQCVEAIAVALTAVVIIFQVRRMKEESTEFTADALRGAVGIIDAPRFAAEASEIVRWEKSRFRYSDRLIGHVLAALSELELLGALLEKEYIHEELLFSVRGVELARLANALHSISAIGRQKVEPKGWSRYIEMYEAGLKLRPRAAKMLVDVRSWGQEFSQLVATADVQEGFQSPF